MKDRKPDLDQMSESEVSLRKFLKQLGVTAHQKLTERLEEAVIENKVAAGSACQITAKIHIEELNFSHEITATLVAPDSEAQ